MKLLGSIFALSAFQGAKAADCQQRDCATGATCLDHDGNVNTDMICECDTGLYGDGYTTCQRDSNGFATQDYGADCINGWTPESSTASCSPPQEVIDSISCTTTDLQFSLKPSHVYDDYTMIPESVMNTMKVEIVGSSGVYEDFVTFSKCFKFIFNSHKI